MREILASSSLAVLIFVSGVHTGCGDDKTRFLPPLEGGGDLTCAEGEFRLVGAIDEQSIDLLDSTAGGGWARIGSASFDTQYSTLAIDAKRTRLSMEWHDNLDRDTFDATGTLRMGTAGVLPGQSFCLGAGTQVNFAPETLEFKLQGLRRGPACSEPVAGSLMGCFR
jgi:hypothetical protein